MALSPGDPLPDVILYEGEPAGKVCLKELFGLKRGVLFGVIGAFTPTCSKTHLPGFVEAHPELLAKGVEVVACVSVNDPFTHGCWGQAHKADGKIIMLADPRGEFTALAGLGIDLTKALGGIRCKRFAMIINEGVVADIQVEPDGGGTSCSLASHVIEKLDQLNFD